MEPRRIILAHVPRFLREMLERAFAKVPGLQIVDAVADLSQVANAIARTDAHWVIVSLPPEGPLSTEVNRLLAAHPATRLVNVATDGSHVTLQWLEPHKQSLDEFSLGELIALLRDEPRDPANAAAGS